MSIPPYARLTFIHTSLVWKLLLKWVNDLAHIGTEKKYIQNTIVSQLISVEAFTRVAEEKLGLTSHSIIFIVSM